MHVSVATPLATPTLTELVLKLHRLSSELNVNEYTEQCLDEVTSCQLVGREPLPLLNLQRHMTCYIVHEIWEEFHLASLEYSVLNDETQLNYVT